MIPRREWLAMLARMSTPHDPVKAMEAMLHYLPLLADLPEAAFTPASLEAVAMAPQNLHIRTLREVKEPLQSWWRDNGPRRVALPAPPPEPETQVSAEERVAVARQLKELADMMAARNPDTRPKVRAHTLAPATLEKLRADARANLRVVS
jgi:hypothetical protein